MKTPRYNIGVRLGSGFALLLAMMLALAVTGINSLGAVQARLHSISDDHMRHMEMLHRMSDSVHIVARVSRTMALLHEKAAMEHEAGKISAARARYDTAFAAYAKGADSAAEKRFVERLHMIQASTRPLNNEVLTLARAGRQAEATALLLTRSGPLTQDWQNLIAGHIAEQHKAAEADVAEATLSYQHAYAFIVALSVLALVCGAVLAWRVTRSITVPVRAAMRVAQTVAAGDLSSVIDGHEGDETGRLMLALREMNDSLANIVGQVRAGTDSIATASSEIASGNLDLSSRTEQQASALEETASSMEEMTLTTRQSAENARQASVLAASASSVAQHGGAVVARVVETMHGINEASRKIVDIIAVIDGIAFQTNILALNAAVEAARAGEQGRGFAVVASEVRNLAQRSALAAKDIKVLIGDSVRQVDTGARLVGDAGGTMAEMVASVRRVTDIMVEISAASAEQEAGIEQINQAISEIDTVTQQNAALVEEAAAAAAALQMQSAGLACLVGRFTLAGASASASAPVRSASVATPAPVRRAEAPRVTPRPLLVANGLTRPSGC
ncbi:MCP four helix bundle domain-containing protein [Massilia violaceinigra]|uniref:MCP four helix bundle domain-containing protein n=1 Tax=Massilia violaceinigra TaxID=2045208 RepID=A0ABY4AES0_9BURK|nr:methyl-accepting chemotaxis protein [Massilia violaceinigra]UOD31058.1 MCP four helix bundle domain-containing protein [Massilia violaceinigra]